MNIHKAVVVAIHCICLL